MPNVVTEFVPVYLNIEEIRTLVAAQNVFRTLTVHKTELALTTNVQTLVLEFVGKIRIAK